jgi:WD40 repeat protein/tRNA A-37 threonylcarbamoyl transferase component Bud32
MVGFDDSAASGPAAVRLLAVAEENGRLVGGKYRLKEILGQGANGVVWRARDELLHRDVAIKEVRLPPGIGPDEIRSLNARTLREARSAARLAHPGIIVVYEVLHEGDHPWIVMELVKGRTLQEIIKSDGPQPPRGAAEIGARILAALWVAHRAGVVHRDIKPSNVLLEGQRVVVTDFGIAALDGGTILTQTGALLGTPAYMAPEQAQGLPADPASDLWSLGATLYTMVEGHPPFRGESAVPVLAAVLTGDHPPPEHAGPLTAVIEGLLVKDPSRRMSAEEAARHLTLVANGEPPPRPAPGPPLEGPRPARPPSGRRPDTSSGVTLPDDPEVRPSPHSRIRILAILTASVVLLAAALWGFWPSEDQPQAASPSAQRPRVGGGSPATTLTSDASPFSVAFSRDGKELAVGSDDSTMRWWDLESGDRSAQTAPHADSVFHVAFSPDGGRLATACADGTVRLWNSASRTQTDVLTGHKDQVFSVAFSPDGKTLASGSKDGTIRLWNATTGVPIWALNGHMGKVHSVSFGRDGKTLIAGGSDGTIRRWNIASRAPAGSLRGDRETTAVAFGSDGRTVATGTWAGSVRLWDLASHARLATLTGHTGGLNSVTFSPDGKTLASGGEDGKVMLWDVSTHARLATLTAHTGHVYLVTFSPDGRTLATGAQDKTVRLWNSAR